MTNPSWSWATFSWRFAGRDQAYVGISTVLREEAVSHSRRRGHDNFSHVATRAENSLRRNKSRNSHRHVGTLATFTFHAGHIANLNEKNLLNHQRCSAIHRKNKDLSSFCIPSLIKAVVSFPLLGVSPRHSKNPGRAPPEKKNSFLRLAAQSGQHRISKTPPKWHIMISSANANSFPTGLKLPELETAAASPVASGSATPELKMAMPMTPPSLKMRRSHASPSQAGKIPTLDDISSISRRLLPMKSSQGDVNNDDDDAMSIDDVLAGALVASPIHRPTPSVDEHKLRLGPPLRRPPSFHKVDTDSCWQKTIPHHVTPPTSQNSSSSSLNVDRANQHDVATGAAPSSSCSSGFIGGTSKSAFAANNYHGAAPEKGKA